MEEFQTVEECLAAMQNDIYSVLNINNTDETLNQCIEIRDNNDTDIKFKFTYWCVESFECLCSFEPFESQEALNEHIEEMH